jgi:hypothetical protein
LDYLATPQPDFPKKHWKEFSAISHLTTTTFRTTIENFGEMEIKYLDKKCAKLLGIFSQIHKEKWAEEKLAASETNHLDLATKIYVLENHHIIFSKHTITSTFTSRILSSTLQFAWAWDKNLNHMVGELRN